MNYLVYFLPLCAAMLYAFSAICTKRALESGAGIARTFFITNLFTVLFSYILLLALRPAAPALSEIMPSLICGVLFFVGQAMIFCSIRLGDVSIQVPLLGMKVIFVSVLVVIFTKTEASNRLIIASLITMLGVACLGFSHVKFTRQALYTIFFVIFANLSFASSDCLMQLKMSDINPFWFMAIMYSVTMLLSLGIIPFFKAPLRTIPKESLPWFLMGSSVMALQGFPLVIAIGIYKLAAQANIIYSTRGLWSIILVGFAGKLLGLKESAVSKRLMLQRLAGSLLLLIAVAVAIA